MHKAVKPFINELNETITNNLLDKIENKRIIVDVSGGHDTRTNLSILLKHNIEFTAYTTMLSKGDIKIAKKIAKEFNLKHIINDEKDENKRKSFGEQIKKEYDLTINGGGYYVMCMLQEQYKSYNLIKKWTTMRLETNDSGNHYCPAGEKNVYEIIKKIPIIYLMGRIPQKEMIKLNEPRLLIFPFTYYDFRQQMMNIFYPKIADFVFNSYFKGKGRNYTDNKKQKGRWWEE